MKKHSKTTSCKQREIFTYDITLLLNEKYYLICGWRFCLLLQSDTRIYAQQDTVITYRLYLQVPRY